jgi:hypothetical protein
MKLVQVVVGGAAVFGAAVWGGFTWAKSGQQLEQAAGGSAAAGAGGGHDADGGGSCAFDRLADVYDSIVGTEERGMFMGLLRWWLLRGAEVRVLWWSCAGCAWH